jgi:predicted acylesterase/phospholipase RssA
MIEHLVLSGAAINGLMQVGILDYLIETNVFKMSDIKSIYATSAGALISILLLIGVSISEIKEYIINRPWEKFFDIDLNFQEKGIYPSKCVYGIIKPFIQANDMESCTLLDLYNKTGVDFHIFTTKINGMETIDLNHITHPLVTIQQAVNMTASVPVLFPPVKYENEYYIDGAILNRCPLQSIQKHNYNIDSILIVDIIDDITLYTDDSTILNFISILFTNCTYILCADKYNDSCINKYKYYYRITADNIFNSNVWLDFLNNIECRQQVYEKGYNHLKKIEMKQESSE